MSYDTNNIFARIIRGEIPATKLYEDEHLIVIADIAPAAPVHVLVMPKGHYVSFVDFTTHAPAAVVARFFATVPVIARQLKVEASGYRLITNHGADASQTVPHFHLHMLGGKPMGELLAH